ncbi:MAG: Na/Pi cotransporter family protein, partial [Oscillospiraceae bacterium]|nr:Na/Pi cotransporter family protein [Oscillospiraceae bacterium]
MSIFNVFKLLGGLALFLYGMDVMGKALEKQAGSKLHSILEKLTSSPLKGFLLGLVVTAIIQSSSATTVMVVGFVNSGIMTLRQSIGIILGANIGTSATSWILSLSGLEGDTFWIKMLKPDSFTPILAIIGIFLLMFIKKSNHKDTALIFLGFAILMFGMDTMSSAVEPLSESEKFQEILLLFSNPILGVLAGAVLTAIIQSSSASVGILQALALKCTVTYSTAIPIIMGQNIGTCITAMISSIGANKNARRTAIVHLSFNLLNSTILLIAYSIANGIVDFAFADNSVTPAGIATVHTIFNVAGACIFLPLTGMLEKLACTIIKDSKNENDNLELLEARFLSTPPIAIQHCKNVSFKMAD